MNVELLEKIKKRILKQPKRFNMEYWGHSPDNCSGVLERPVCNTQACIAGETVLQKRLARIDRVNGGLILKNTNRHIATQAAELLALTEMQADRLFYTKTFQNRVGWPAQFEVRYGQATTPEERAQVAADRIDHFIKTNGAE